MNIDELVVQNAEWIRITARRYYSDPDLADDLASDTIYKCLSNAGHFDSTRSFKPWALTIMENTFKTQYNRRRCVLFTSLDDGCTAFVPDDAGCRVAMLEVFEAIRKCARDSRCIESVILYAKGYGYDEIAEISGIPVGTVKSRIAAGRKILREALS